MYIKKKKGPGIVTLPDGTTISRADLPSPDTRRWVARRKAMIVSAVQSGLIDAEEACSTYDLSAEELESWCKAVNKHGKAALRVTRLKRYRQP